MPPLSIEKLRILTFPQHINGDELDLHILLLPTQNLLNARSPFASQIHPGTTVLLPKFITATLKLEIITIKGLSTYPFSEPQVLANEGVTADPHQINRSFPGNLPTLYEGLAERFKIDVSETSLPVTTGTPSPLDPRDGIRKYLPLSYRNAFNFTNVRTEFAKTDDSYHCAIKRSPGLNPAFKQSPDDISWGRAIAFCLRQPLLAESIGLLHRVLIKLPTADYFANGGWVYCDLTDPNEFDILPADKDRDVKLYAARIPNIDDERQLFAAILFPVMPKVQPPGEFDTLKIEAADYDDGFAKIVHAVQPVSANLLSEEPDGIHVQKDVGIRLGWDDEQLLIWQNRQLLADPNTLGKRIDAPLGVFTYRVDVRETNAPHWRSLVLIRNKDDLTLAGEPIAPAKTPLETGVQVYPARINGDLNTPFWLPSYFSQWYGSSLVLPDTRAARLDASGALKRPGLYQDANIPAQPDQKGGLYEPLLPEDCELKYGKEYEFRVRLADLTGGGPKIGDVERNDAPATSSSIIFKRFVAPKQLKVVPVSPQPAPVRPAPNAGTSVFYEGDSFAVTRPRLGYPALLFTEMDTNDAFKKLLADRKFLHKGKTGGETIKETREVSYFDPDVDQMMVIVEVRSLLLDNLASLNQREAFIPLYTTFRTFSNDPEESFTLDLEYRDANVIDFGNKVNLGDLNISQTEIDSNDEIVLPRSRDIRITLFPVCSDKPGNLAYFGFAETLFAGEFVRTGEPVQFFVRQDATEEQGFFRTDLESRQLQGLYLQPDPPQVNNPTSFIAETVAGKELDQSTLIQRLAAQLRVDSKGLTLIGKPGERIQFGCSNRIRHTLAPDNSSVTFATKGDLINHWLCVLSFEVNRDWTWDGMSEEGIEIVREKNFTDEAATREEDIVGYVQLKKTASRLAAMPHPDRSFTRIVFIDAVEPKKELDKPTTTAQPFPNTIETTYTLIPHFIAGVSGASTTAESESRELQLPVTTIPAQVMKIVAAGFALSPYRRNQDYSETAVRERYLWLEFEEPIRDPDDTCFARVLTYAPDPLLSYPDPDQGLVKQDDPPLAIDPEPIRVITKGHGNDNAGIDAMQMMTPETAPPDVPLVKLSPVHYLLPLPPGLHNDSGELFGFFTYELRVGHTTRIWCTARGRFGHPTRVNGVQHPAPALKCLVDRTPKKLCVTAQYAQALFNGKNVTSKPPKTEIWCLLYAQLRQADDKENRNILLAEVMLECVDPSAQLKISVGEFLRQRQSTAVSSKTANSLQVNLDEPATGIAEWTEPEIRQLLDQFNLARGTRLSVLAVEMMPRYDQYFDDERKQKRKFVLPLSLDLGFYRILRTSPLVAAPEVC